MNILDFAANLPDHRQQFKIRHLSTDIIFITVAAVICGAEDWEDIEDFGHCKEKFFRNYLQLPNGIPSHDTFNRFFANLDPDAMETQFRIWVKDLCSERTELVAIDGKTLRGAKRAGKSLFHMVSAFCHANGLSLAQVKTAEKSNEITAIPELLKVLELEECIVSIDAMGCQQEIAKAIVDKKANFILAVKNNQKELFQGIEETFRFEKKQDSSCAKDLDFGHGRIENRTCCVSSNLEYIDTNKWPNVVSLIKVVSERYDKTNQRQEETAIRYYISSLTTENKRFNSLIRAHWAIENNLHWMLDVTMGEDASRKRAKNSPRNFSVIAKTVLTMVKKYKPLKGGTSIKRKRKMGGWSDEHLIAMMGMEPC